MSIDYNFRSSISSDMPNVTMESATAITSTPDYVYVACGPGLVHCYKYNNERKGDKKTDTTGSRRLPNASHPAGDVGFYHRVKEIRIPIDPNMSTDTGISSNQLITQLNVGSFWGAFLNLFRLVPQKKLLSHAHRRTNCMSTRF